MPQDYIIYNHRRSEIETLGELITRNDVQLFSEDYTAEDILNYRPINFENTNKDIIFNQYTKQEKKDNENKPADQLLLKVNTPLYFPKDKIRAETLFVADSNQISKQTNVNAFLADQLNRLLNDPNYVQVDKLRGRQGTNVSQHPNITVWAWLRALGNGSEGQWLNISPFITSCDTTVGTQGGNFSISLSEIRGRYNERGVWNIADITSIGENYNTSVDIHKYNQGKEKRNNFFFHDVIQENDLVYIRYETLALEKEKRKKQQNKFVLNNTDIPGNTYDMIGLVDTNNLSFGAQNNEIGINITGRDLMKVAIEDGCYFFSLEFGVGATTTLGQRERNRNKIFRRSALDGDFKFLNAYTNRTIQFSLRFVIQQLSNSGLVPNEVFSGYPKKDLTRKFIKDEQKLIEKQERLEGIKESGVLTVKRARRQNNLSLPNKAGENGAANNVFQIIVDLIEDNNLFTDDGLLTQQAQSLLEGQLYVLSEITSSFFNQGLGGEAFATINQYVSYKDEVPDTPYESNLADGVWQIIKLVIEGENWEDNQQTLSNRRIVDSSIAAEQGSILNYIQKICQEPFAEFRGDTYGDKYYFVVRSPPFDKKKFQGLTYGNINTEITPEAGVLPDVPDDLSGLGTFSDTVIEIDEKDIIQENLGFNNKEVYTFYRLRPRGLFWGNSSAMAQAFLPAIYLDEYADVWGSRPNDVPTNYIVYKNINDTNKTKRESYLQSQAFYDLKYMIDCNSYLPFTKDGTITINGDRRVKRGTCIYHKSRNEVYYVDAVQQSYSVSNESIDRITTLTVSRGMKEPYIRGQTETFLNDEGEPVSKKISYFDIVKTPINDSVFEQDLGGLQLSDQIFKNWTVDKDIFSFFLKRRFNKE